MKNALYLIASLAFVGLFVGIGAISWFMGVDAADAVMRGNWRWAAISIIFAALGVLLMVGGILVFNCMFFGKK